MKMNKLVALQYKSQNKLAGKKVPSANNPKSKHYHSIYLSNSAKENPKKQKRKNSKFHFFLFSKETSSRNILTSKIL